MINILRSRVFQLIKAFRIMAHWLHEVTKTIWFFINHCVIDVSNFFKLVIKTMIWRVNWQLVNLRIIAIDHELLHLISIQIFNITQRIKVMSHLTWSIRLHLRCESSINIVLSVLIYLIFDWWMIVLALLQIILKN